MRECPQKKPVPVREFLLKGRHDGNPLTKTKYPTTNLHKCGKIKSNERPARGRTGSKRWRWIANQFNSFGIISSPSEVAEVDEPTFFFCRTRTFLQIIGVLGSIYMATLLIAWTSFFFYTTTQQYTEPELYLIAFCTIVFLVVFLGSYICLFIGAKRRKRRLLHCFMGFNTLFSVLLWAACIAQAVIWCGETDERVKNGGPKMQKEGREEKKNIISVATFICICLCKLFAIVMVAVCTYSSDLAHS